MSREIKFRAWSFLLSEYLEPAYTGQEFQWIHEGHDICIEQFTGLQDKNGVEIYSGDIIAFSYFGDEDGEHEIYKIVFHAVGYSKAIGFHCVDKDGKPYDFYGGIPDSDSIKVIGNIHQNGDLLK